MEEHSAAAHIIHPAAKALLTAAFYTDRDHPDGPFSYNRISDTFGEFSAWRTEHPYEPASTFFPEPDPADSNPWYIDREITGTAAITAFYDQRYHLQLTLMLDYADAFSHLNQMNGITMTAEEMAATHEESARHLSYSALKEHDDQVISAGFGQFALEGVIDPQLKEWTRKALLRQLDPMVLDRLADPAYSVSRKACLELMLADLQQIPAA